MAAQFQPYAKEMDKIADLEARQSETESTLKNLTENLPEMIKDSTDPTIDERVSSHINLHDMRLKMVEETLDSHIKNGFDVEEYRHSVEEIARSSVAKHCKDLSATQDTATSSKKWDDLNTRIDSAE